MCLDMVEVERWLPTSSHLRSVRGSYVADYPDSPATLPSVFPSLFPNVAVVQNPSTSSPSSRAQQFAHCLSIYKALHPKSWGVELVEVYSPDLRGLLGACRRVCEADSLPGLHWVEGTALSHSGPTVCVS